MIYNELDETIELASRHDFSNIRVGLALCGGGGKGAYQIGCWKALRKHVRRFHAVAGTSVGALNAFLIAAGRPDTAENIWTRLRRNQVIGIQGWRSIFLPLWLFSAAVSEFFPVNFNLTSPMAHPDRFWHWLYPLFIIWMVFVGLCLLGTELSSNRVALNYVLGLLFVMAVVATTHRILRYIFLKLTVTTNHPLRELLESKITDEDTRKVQEGLTAAFATVSRFRPWTMDSMEWAGWVPEYIKLDRYSHSEIMEILLQSACLPGIFPARRVLGELAVDGGCTDNDPIAPLVYGDVSLDLIFVIFLSPDPKKPRGTVYELFRCIFEGTTFWPKPEDRGIIELAKLKWQVAEVSKYGEQEARKLEKHRMDKGEWDLYDRIFNLNRPLPRIVPIYPSQSLGNFISGTLWFDGDKATQQMALGEKDMDELLKKLIADPDSIIREISKSL